MVAALDDDAHETEQRERYARQPRRDCCPRCDGAGFTVEHPRPGCTCGPPAAREPATGRLVRRTRHSGRSRRVLRTARRTARRIALTATDERIAAAGRPAGLTGRRIPPTRSSPGILDAWTPSPMSPARQRTVRVRARLMSATARGGAGITGRRADEPLDVPLVSSGPVHRAWSTGQPPTCSRWANRVLTTPPTTPTPPPPSRPRRPPPRLGGHPVRRGGPRSSCAPPTCWPGRGGRNRCRATMLASPRPPTRPRSTPPCELVDFWRFNVAFARQILGEQPISSPGCGTARTPPAGGLRLRDHPVQLHRHRREPPTAPALMGNTVIWKPSPTQTFAAYLTMQLLSRPPACRPG